MPYGSLYIIFDTLGAHDTRCNSLSLNDVT